MKPALLNSNVRFHMRPRLLTFLMLLTICFSLRGELSLNLSQILKNDIWSLAEGTHNELPLVIRFRTELTTDVDVSGYPLLIPVFW